MVPIARGRTIVVAYDDNRRRANLRARPTVIAIEVGANNDTTDKAADGGGNLVAPVACANRRGQGRQRGQRSSNGKNVVFHGSCKVGYAP